MSPATVSLRTVTLGAILLPIAAPPLRGPALAGLWALVAVFGLRGIAAYLPGWRRLTPEQPFARLDRMVYGPLCMGIGVLIADTATRMM